MSEISSKTSSDYSEKPIDVLTNPEAPVQVRLDAILGLLNTFEVQHFHTLKALLLNPAENVEVRCAIALTLARIGASLEPDIAWSAEIRTALVELTADSESTLRNYAVQALGVLGHAEAAPWLIEALKDESKAVFASAAKALGKLGKPVLPALVELLQTGADDARCVAAWQLGENGNRSVALPLAERVRQESNTDVVALCIWALGKIGEGLPEVTEALVWAKQQDEPDIRLRAELALKKIARHSN